MSILEILSLLLCAYLIMAFDPREMRGCITTGLCFSLERPIYRFFNGDVAFVKRYAMLDELVFGDKEKTCQEFEQALMNLIRAREAGYPRTLPFEKIWMELGQFEKCWKGTGILIETPVISYDSDREIEYTERLHDGAYILTYWSTTFPAFPGYKFRHDPNVWVNV